MKRIDLRLIAMSWSLSVGLACSPATQPVPPSPPQQASAAPAASQPTAEPAAESSDAKALVPPVVEAEPKPEAASGPNQVVDEACNALCDSAAKECSRRSARSCRANCERYLKIADRCEGPVLEALKCQASVPGLVCSNVVGECGAEFRALSACEDGLPAGEPAGPRSQPRLPAGWVQLKDTSIGFLVGFPKLVAAANEEGRRTWRVREDDGVSYVVSVMPPFKTEVDDKNLVRKVLTLVGIGCQKDMKIHGRFEEAGKMAVRFDTRCRDGNAWHGMLRISDEHVIMTAEIVPQGASATGDPFYYSFSYL